MKKEFFVCDGCGTRTRLNSAERHWCSVCNQGAPVEMRHVRDKKPLIPNTLAPLVSPIRAPLKVRRFSPDGQILVGIRPSPTVAPFRFTHSVIIEKRSEAAG